MEKTLRAQKILSPGMKITSSVSNNTLQFSVFPDKDMKDSTNTLKIRAVLLAKNLMSADKALQRVDVRFHGKEFPDKFTEITVRSVDVKAFGAGLTTEDELMNSLQVNEGRVSNAKDNTVGTALSAPTSESGATSKSAESTSTANGARKEERIKLAARVQALKSKGVGIKPFLTQLEALDNLAKAGESVQLSEKLEQMDSSIADQERVLAERERANTPVRAEVPAKVAAAQNPVARPGPGPAGMKGQLATMLGQSPDSAPLMRLFEGMARNAREKYGIDPDLIPEAGPYFNERWNLGLQVKLRREQGLGDAIMPMWFQCQELAKMNDKMQVAYKMQNIAKAMRLPDPIARADWYQAQMELYKEKFHRPHHHD
ncbi:MAG: hypothetical protein HYX67_07415 [Candidatus Melainabacteria bacterium]|nr:hypothetical protein [Candidatus Melainabacteria bacterium]